jgi:hypothetical protein
LAKQLQNKFLNHQAILALSQDLLNPFLVQNGLKFPIIGSFQKHLAFIYFFKSLEINAFETKMNLGSFFDTDEPKLKMEKVI